MKNVYRSRFWLRSPLALLAGLLLTTPALAQQLVGRAAATVAARRQVLREALRLPAAADLRPLETEPDALGFVHEQYQLYYQGVKVEHARVRVHSRAGRVEVVSGEAPALPARLSVQPALSEAAALQRALRAIGARTYKWQLPAEEAALKAQTGNATASYRPDGELVLVRDSRPPAAARPLVLAWKFNIYAHEPASRAWYYVDAQTGQVVLQNSIIKHANAPGASFATRYVGPRTSITDNTGSGYRLRETATSRGVTTLNVRRGNSFSTAIDFVDNDNNWTAAEHDNATFDNAALDAHLGAQTTQSYWSSIHGRDSYDDRGSVLLSYVHYDATPSTPAGTDNAYWDGTAMLYGDGNTLFKPLTAIDVCGHEIGHAVCEATADLTYSYESGAMNEGFSDIWGACVENHFDPAKQHWLIGEDICKPSFGLALRSMSNPNQFGQPDTYKGTSWATGPGDNGGVHTNSGVLNYWFYLLCEGGAGLNDFGTSYSVTGITIAKAERIAYRAERFYLTASSQYINARQATIQAAIDLYGLGSAEATATAQAWRAVGVGTSTGALEAAPTISGFSPGSGTVGAVVTISGANLGATYRATFNGVDASVATLSTGGTVSVTVPAGASTGVITLTTPSGSVSTATSFTVNSPGLAPTIASYAPAAGQVQGGGITITGTNFTGASAVRFNGTAATGFSVVNATTITATVPAGATSGPLTVTTANGTATAPTSFLVLPAITGFSPPSGTVGTTVTLTGTSFTGALNVKFNDVYATSFTVVNATTITAPVPTGATTGPITVRTPSGTATSPGSFTVTASLAFDSFSPAAGTVGTVVSIRGRGFTGTSAVKFGGVTAPTFTVVSDLEIWATVPAGALTGPIVLTTPLGTATSASNFTVDPGLPIVSSFSPTSGAVGTAVTLTGNYFTGATAVRFNGTAATFTVVNNTTINTTVPGGATSGPVSVTNAAGTGTSSASFGVAPDNDVCSASVPQLACGGTVTGTTVGVTSTGDPTASCGGTTPSASGGVFYRLTGTGSSITLTACTGTSYDMVLFVYTGSCGSYTCVASDDDGCGNTNGGPSKVTFNSTSGTPYLIYVTGFNTAQGAFTLAATCGAAPTITSFAPGSGAAGTPVTLTGTNLSGASAVTVNGVSVVPGSVTATSLSFTVPAGCGATQSITVTAAGGSSAANTSFSVQLRPAVAGTLPAVNALAAARPNSAVAIGFSEPVTSTSLAGARVFSAQTGGSKAGSWTTSGSTASFVSSLAVARRDFRAGEVVSVTLPPSVQSTGGLSSAKRVYQFTAATSGAGRGGFGGGSSPAPGGSINGLALGDVNGDGLPDLLTAGYNNPGTVGVALNDGAGGYGAPTSVNVGNYPITLALADVDADGDLDFVTCNYGNPAGSGSTATVCRNNGSGTFPPGQSATLATGAGPRGLALGDLDGDGDLDMIIPVASGVTVWRNDGAGGFTLSSTVAGISFSTGAVLGDVDGDGDLDMAVNSYNNNTGTVVHIRLNDGSGAFSGTQNVAVGQGPFVALLGDLDGDGDLDLASTSETNSTVSLRFNDGSGTFAPPAIAANGEVAVGSSPLALALGDVDADGDLDLVSGGPTGLAVRINNGSGVFAPPFANGTVAGAANFLALADLDNDGDLDLASANGGSAVAVRLNLATIPLPVELTSFSAEAQGESVQLRWRTAQEKSNARFEVERSLDGQRFERIGMVTGQGTTTSPTTYGYLDARLPAAPNPREVLHYRLRQVDEDGTGHYSQVRTVLLAADGRIGLAPYPQPVPRGERLHYLRRGELAQEAELTVYALTGRRLASHRLASGASGSIPTDGLPAGCYLLRLRQADGSTTTARCVVR